jgi:hypothetical protein
MDDLRRIDLNLLLTLHALLTEQHVTRAAVRLHRASRPSATRWPSCAISSTTRCWCGARERPDAHRTRAVCWARLTMH